MARGRKGAPIEGRPGWARRLAETRAASPLRTQDALARALGKPQQTVAGWESGSSEPDIATFERLGAALGVSAAWLAFGSDPSEENGILASFPGGQEQRRRAALAIGTIAQMLNEEGIGADLGFIVGLARKITRASQAIEDSLKAQQLIREHVEQERAEIRRGLADLRKKLL